MATAVNFLFSTQPRGLNFLMNFPRRKGRSLIIFIKNDVVNMELLIIFILSVIYLSDIKSNTVILIHLGHEVVRNAACSKRAKNSSKFLAAYETTACVNINNSFSYPLSEM